MSVRIVSHAVAIPGPQIPRRRRWVKPRTSPTAHMPLSTGAPLSGLYGVRYRQPVGRVRLPKPDWVTRFADDRDLAGVKFALLGLAVLIVMVLEVPW